MKIYPQVIKDNIQEHTNVLKQIARLRQEDVQEFTNLTQVFISGRKVGKIPTSSADITPSDRVGDFSFDPDYIYIVVDDGGAVWRRATLGSW
jgi:hypothetical protein